MKSNNFKKKGFLYAGLALLCFINITSLWIFLIIFAGLSALYFWLSNRHKNDKNNIIEQAMQNSKEKKKRKRNKADFFGFEEKRRRKAAYNEHIAAIEAEFSDDIFNEYSDENYDEYDDDDDDEDDDF